MRITVNTLVDEMDGSITDGDVSLRDAIALANVGDHIDFESALFAADDDPANNTSINLTLGDEIVISKDLTINGDTNGDGIADVTIDAAGNNGIGMFIVDSGDAAVSALFESLYFTGVRALNHGGVIFVEDHADVKVLNSTFHDNKLSFGIGGAIRVDGTATIVNSTFTENQGSIGGAIWNSGTLSILNSTFHRNLGTSFGGPPNGGAIHTQEGALTLTNTTISGNFSRGDGGGLGTTSGNVTIANSIIAGNLSNAGIDNVAGIISSNGANIFGNTTLGSAAGDIELTGASGNALEDVFNEVEDRTIFRNGEPYATFETGVLSNNGGPTQTIGIKFGGLAHDAGEAGTMPTEEDIGIDVDGDGVISANAIETDQRGADRMVVQINIGAVERSAGTIVVNTIADEVDGIADGSISLRDAILASIDGDTIEFDPTIFVSDNDFLSNAKISLSLGELIIDKSLAINGDTNDDGIADVTLSGAGQSRVLNVTGGESVFQSLTIIDGAANGDGGGLRIGSDAVVVLNASTIANNAASSDGGGLAVFGALELNGSTINANASSDFGGGIFVSEPGSTDATNSTIFGNTSTGLFGGGIYSAGSLDLLNVTITGNSAGSPIAGLQTSRGGGIYATGEVEIANSIVIGNDSEIDANGVLSVDAQVSNSLLDETIFDPADIFDGEAALADNGGPVLTIALKNSTSNAAIDGGDDSLAPSFDAVGNQRIIDFVDIANNGDNLSDLGALEKRGAPPVFLSTSAVVVLENQTSVIDLEAIAQTAVEGIGISYSLVDEAGNDEQFFELNVATGVLSLKAGLDFENPLDGNLDNTYEVLVRANSDAVFGPTHELVSVSITDVNDAPIVSEQLQDQTIARGLSIRFTLPENSFTDVDNSELSFEATLASGAALPDWLTFDPQTREFSGTPRNFEGSLTLMVTASDDELSVSDVFDLVVTPAEPIDLVGGREGELLIGGLAKDTITGNLGDDVIEADDGDDVILDAGGKNTVNAGGGDDRVALAAGDNAVNGAAGGDLLVGGIDTDVLDGGSGNDVIVGDISDLIGAADQINGGSGDDMLEGGVGADTFVFGTNDGSDTIGRLDMDFATLSNTAANGADFVSGVDLIALESGFGITTGAEALSHVSDVGGVATFTDQGTTITFAGLTTSDLAADDFTFL